MFYEWRSGEEKARGLQFLKTARCTAIQKVRQARAHEDAITTHERKWAG
jgi:hypothetical protein